MGQALSRHERPGGFWRRRKPKAAAPASFSQTVSQTLRTDKRLMQMDQSSAHASISPTMPNTTPRSVTPFPDIFDGAMENRGNNKAGEPGKMEIDKVEKQACSSFDQPMSDASDKPDKPDKPEIPETPNVFDKCDQPTQPAAPPTRPALKREFTPPHRIKIWSEEAWHVESRFSKLYDEVTKTLNQIRSQQVSLNHKRPRHQDRKMQLDIYNACDSCTLSLEYLVGHFSTRFFHHQGPENIVDMMAVIDADTAKIDDLRMNQMRMANCGYNLERAVGQTERHIRELAELAKRIKETADEAEEEKMEEFEDYEDDDEDMDAEGDSDPEFRGQANGNEIHS